MVAVWLNSQDTAPFQSCLNIHPWLWLYSWRRRCGLTIAIASGNELANVTGIQVVLNDVLNDPREKSLNEVLTKGFERSQSLAELLSLVDNVLHGVASNHEL